MSSFAEATEDNFLSAPERKLVRAAGIEPASHAWEARIIPIYYARKERAGTKRRRPATGKSRMSPVLL
jgi:hypothetical protein